jgi:hypothetical protein
MRLVLLFIAVSVLFGGKLSAQNESAPPPTASKAYTQRISGIVTDAQSQSPIPDVMVIIVDSTLKIGTRTDENGRYVLEGVPVGRRTIRFSIIGYEERYLNNVLITSGKEAVYNLEMVEKVTTTETVEIVGQAEKGKANNDMTTVSSKAFSADEAGRFAGSLNDPARMAMNFAGVASAGDSRNDIIIRGNSPTGLLWRMEGVDIPNPNHFASSGSNGGPISILNNNVLGSSDFLTGAFPAEYSNGTSGVFDLKMRTGNANRRETMFQMGFNGIELMTEGPISKKNYSSYLASYRYSTLAVFDAIGIKFGDLIGIPKFQDLSFKVNFPTTKAGTFTIWGMGGQSEIEIIESKLTEKQWENEVLAYEDVKVSHFRGVTGLTHALVLNPKSSLKTTIAYAFENRKLSVDTVFQNRQTAPEFFDDTRNRKLTLNITYYHKFNSRHSIKAGGFADHHILNFKDSTFLYNEQRFLTLHEFEGSTQLYRLYAQWQFRITPKLTLNSGINSMYLAVNKDFAAEPRAGIRWQFMPKHAFSLAYGMHNQTQNLALYFYKNRQNEFTNKDLKFTRSQHFVLGYDWVIATQWRAKIETYYQHLDQIPIESLVRNSYSMFNFGAGFENVPDINGLVSKGTARNIGAEITLERYLNKGFYVLLTGSLFDSRYKGSSEKEYHSVWSLGYVANALAGAEVNLDKNKKWMLFADLKVTVAGGNRFTPINMEASQRAGETIRIDSLAFTEQLPAYFRADIKLGVRWNSKRLWQEFAFNIQNFTNYQNVFTRQYDLRTNSIITRYQLGFFPVFQYKITF